MIKKQICPNCGREISVSSFKKHYNACINPNSKIHQKEQRRHLSHEGLNCIYCGRVCKNKNSLVQHEIRCPQNPNRKDYNKLGAYSAANFKNQTVETNPIIRRAHKTRAENTRSPNYVDPRRGKVRQVCYIYKEHNKEEIKKWFDFLNQQKDRVDQLREIAKNFISGNTYSSVKPQYLPSCLKQEDGTAGKYLYQHVFSVGYILNGELPEGSIVHHIDGDKTNNDIYNLLIFATASDHARFHNAKAAWLLYDETSHVFSCVVAQNNKQNK